MWCCILSSVPPLLSTLQTQETRGKESTARKQRRVQRSSVSKVFNKTVKEGPDYACTCCHRLIYRQTVLGFKVDKYSKAPKDLLQRLFLPKFVRASAKGLVWICKMCDCTLKRGRMPAQAAVNKLGLDEIPAELADLNELETRLISRRIS